MESNDNHLIGLIKSGSQTAFDTAYLNYFKQLQRYAFTFTKDNDEAEELIQNVFCRIWEKRTQLDANGQLKSFLYRAVHNECLNYLKHQNVKLSFNNYQQENASITSDPVKEMAAQELEKQLYLAINELPGQCRTIFQLSRIEQLKYQQIADQLNLSIKTVENQMGKALKTLRLKLVNFLPILLIYLTKGL
ncbi:RNA polymerase sigma-70 factor [Pedobacter sp. KR3-3]|uniref:RNA polymerase sigma-70 factor n=1 Tax=Pedobacter albus TaxID=3113905 RepID=A0ABU7I5W6_9SPHI|nr:RNA polymerase sigma-70 factor [Pedobacter sp. KR3-3]MEE1944752.1 RNA polymerase sigma-70 factor [Pedobacter sp. KR3-3]